MFSPGYMIKLINRAISTPCIFFHLDDAHFSCLYNIFIKKYHLQFFSPSGAQNMTSDHKNLVSSSETILV